MGSGLGGEAVLLPTICTFGLAGVDLPGVPPIVLRLCLHKFAEDKVPEKMENIKTK